LAFAAPARPAANECRSRLRPQLIAAAVTIISNWLAHFVSTGLGDHVALRYPSTMRSIKSQRYP
jgi:hypothetical protein